MKSVTEQGFMADEFDWKVYPEAEAFLVAQVTKFLENNAYARKLEKNLYEKTSTRFFDWVDHISIPASVVSSDELVSMGFQEMKLDASARVFKNPGSVLFPVLLNSEGVTSVGIKADELEHVVKALKLKTKIEGKKFSPLRKVEISREGSYTLYAIERRGSNAFSYSGKEDISEYKKALTLFAKRQRKFATDREGMIHTLDLVKKVVRKIGSARAADAFARGERTYWQSRNSSGKLQKKRQDAFGLGWGNHDHHTYRSSRENFEYLIRTFEALGFLCREKFFAGEKAGWGAQILEHPLCDIVIFADVDMQVAERHSDFAHEGLRHRKDLGTVGLWIGLHGESILQAGMHHLEARFDFDKLVADFPKYGKKVMAPFSYFDFLKQAFTQGETWKVDKKRLDTLLKAGSITPESHKRFLKEGAIGSHMENLQRTQGFKGFNQDSVSAIIKATDPRMQNEHRHA